MIFPLLVALLGLTWADGSSNVASLDDSFDNALVRMSDDRRDAFVRSLMSLQNQLDQWQMTPMKRSGLVPAKLGMIKHLINQYRMAGGPLPVKRSFNDPSSIFSRY